MTERRYSEEEVGAIFELASKTQAGGARQLRAGEGMTLAGLQEIGREVGIPPELVAQAARSLDTQGSETTRRLLGMPIGVGRTVDLGRTLGDAEWEQLVVSLRETFDATGKVEVEGAFRQWTNGNLQILVEPTPTGHQLRMKTFRSRSLVFIGGGLALLATLAVKAISVGVAGELGEPKAMTGLLFMAALGLGLFGLGAAVLPGWSRLRRRQMQELAETLTAPIAESSTAPGG